MPKSSEPVTIKKYANRRLYNTESSVYVTLADLAKMVKSGDDFVVHDAKTNEDITRSVLTQIIFEQEGVEGQALLPVAFLRQLIRLYGDSVQTLVPSYLEFSMDRFAVEQEKVRASAQKIFGDATFGGPAFAALEEMTRKNLATFTQALGLFSPFGATAEAAKEPVAAGEQGLADLKAELVEMQRRLARIEDQRG
jgi:polyhydroxyalkanoate synthesis repressor PhaR